MALGMPTNVNTSVSGLNVTITFTKASGADITWLDSYGSEGEFDYWTYGSSFTLDVPWYDYTYYFCLVSENTTEMSPWTQWYSFTTGSDPSTVVPSQPTGITSTVNGLSVTINFSKGSNAYYTHLDSPAMAGEYDFETTGSSFTLGLDEYNKTYQYRLRSVSYYGVVSGWTGYYSFTTGSPPKPSTPSSPPTVTARGEGSLTVSWGSSTDATGYVLSYKPSYLGTWTDVTVAGTSTTLSNLQYGVLYDLTVVAYNSNGWSEYTSIYTAITNPQTPSPIVSAVTQNSITIGISSISGNYSHFIVRLFNSSNVLLQTKNITTVGGTVQFTGLAMATTYKYSAETVFTHYTGEWHSSTSPLTNVQTSARPQNFTGFTHIVSGADFYLTATEWNSFCAIINEFRLYKGLGNYTFTTAVSGSSITATIFNQAVNAMSSLSSHFTGGNTIPTTKSSNDKIYASYFQQLKNSLNSIT